MSLRLFLGCTVIVGALAGAIPPATAAETASRWDGDARSSVRLIEGSAGTAATTHAPRVGVELQLKPGWVTYWRYPGDAGVPPRFDFSGSSNLKSATVLWPAPIRINKEGVQSIGYDHSVIFPLSVVPADPAKPVRLRLKLDYGVCDKLCVPAEATTQLDLVNTPSEHDSALAQAEAQVPRSAKVGASDPLAIRAVHREPKRVVVDVAAPSGAPVDLFAEGPTVDWALPLPMRVESPEPGLHRFTFDLDGAPPGASYQPLRLRLTATSNGQAIEVETRLD